MGLVGLGAAFAVSTTRLQQHWLSVWLAAAAVAGAVGGTLMVRQSRIHGHTLFGAPLRKFLLCLLPAIFAGAVLTAVEWGDGNVAAVPGIWLLLYGSALIAASATTTRFVGAMGALFVLLGGVAFLSPASTHNFLLATGFGGLHLVFGIFLGRLNHGR